MIDNFKLLPKVVQRALIALTPLIILIAYLIVRGKVLPVIVIYGSSYWVFILLFSWVYAATLPQREHKEKIVLKKRVSLTMISIIILGVTFVSATSILVYESIRRENETMKHKELTVDDVARNLGIISNEEQYINQDSIEIRYNRGMEKGMKAEENNPFDYRPK